MSKPRKKPKFRVGQVVRSGDFYGKIIRVCGLTGWQGDREYVISHFRFRKDESDLYPLTKQEAGR